MARKKKELIDIHAASLADITRVFQVTAPTVHNWLKKGCPRNDDDSFTVFNVHKWLARPKDEQKGGLYQEKLRADIERINAQTEKISGQYILRTDHDQVMNSWASSFKKFWGQAVKKNIIHFCNKELDQLHVLFDTFGRGLMDVWADEGTEK